MRKVTEELETNTRGARKSLGLYEFRFFEVAGERVFNAYLEKKMKSLYDN